MNCEIKFQITNLVDGKRETSLLTIAKINKSTVTLDEVAEALLKSDKNTREKIANALRAAKVQSLTEDDIKNHRFVSNTTLDGLKEKYPDLKSAFPNLLTEDTPIIINCNKMQLNGNNYFGRIIDASGKEIYFINNFYGAQKLFNYLDIKNKIKQAVQNLSLNEDLKEYSSDLQDIAKKYKTSIEELLLDYLDNKQKFKPFKTQSGTLIIPFKVLNGAYSKISNKYNNALGKTDLALLLYNINKETKNRFNYKINFNTLRRNLELLLDNVPSSVEWNNMSNDEIVGYLKSIFADDPKLIKAKIKVTGGDQEVEYEDITDIEKEWNKYRNENQEISYDTYENLIKMAKTQPERAILQLQGAFPDAKISFENDKFVVKKPVGKTATVKVSQSELQQIWSERAIPNQLSLKEALEKNPNSVIDYFKGIYNTENVKIVKNKLQVSYDSAKYKPKEILISFPWSSLGEVYDFGYNSNYLFSPVDDDNIHNGVYHGAYIYKYFNGKTTHYAISRSIISPNSYAATYSTLEGAKAKIDEWNNTQIIEEHSLYTIKTYRYIPRVSFIEESNLKSGSILTTLDIELPRINKVTGIFYTAIKGTVPQFYQIFRDISNIKSLETPEQAAAFIYLFYQKLRDLKSNKDVNQLIFEHRDEGAQIVTEILNAPKKSYFIENKQGKEATLKLLKDNGNDIDISGKFKDAEGNLKAANFLSTSDMEAAIDYFNNKLGLNIKSITQSELIEIAKENKFSPNGVRAFILNGDIYINSSNANISDLFHELSHIFLGILKAKDIHAYERVIAKYTKSKRFGITKNYIDRVYQNFAQQDKIEECVADIIAEDMAKTQSLAEVFKGEDFIEQFSAISDDFKKLLQESDNNGLAFKTIYDKEALNRNTRLTTFIKDNIQNGKIIEFNCQ